MKYGILNLCCFLDCWDGGKGGGGSGHLANQKIGVFLFHLT